MSISDRDRRYHGRLRRQKNCGNVGPEGEEQDFETNSIESTSSENMGERGEEARRENVELDWMMLLLDVVVRGHQETNQHLAQLVERLN